MCYMGLPILPNNTYGIARKLPTNLPESVLGVGESARCHNFKLDVSWLFRVVCLGCLGFSPPEFPCQCFKQ